MSQNPFKLFIFWKNSFENLNQTVFFQKRKQKESVAENCMDLCFRNQIMADDPGVIYTYVFEGIRTAVILDQSSRWRQENAAFLVFAEEKNLAELLSDLLFRVILPPGVHINTINNGSRAANDRSIFTTDYLLGFDKCHNALPSQK